MSLPTPSLFQRQPQANPPPEPAPPSARSAYASFQATAIHEQQVPSQPRRRGEAARRPEPSSTIQQVFLQGEVTSEGPHSRLTRWIPSQSLLDLHPELRLSVRSNRRER